MPPSTATYVRMPGMSLIVPTVYTVMAAEATMARPGSTDQARLDPAASTALRSTLAHSVMVGADSPST
jgi:hypothetical protein